MLPTNINAIIQSAKRVPQADCRSRQSKHQDYTYSRMLIGQPDLKEHIAKIRRKRGNFVAHRVERCLTSLGSLMKGKFP
jgi:hypothetical protein